MPSSNQIASIPAAMGDPVRLNMLLSLREDGTMTAGELARVGNVAPSTASEHLAKLMAACLVIQRKVGRKRLYSLGNATVCDLLDTVTALADKIRPDENAGSGLTSGLLHSRLCYDHLAGRLGCALTSAMFETNLLRHGRDGPAVTDAGKAWLVRMGIDHDALDAGPRRTVRLCRDWSEDSHHLGGAVAAAFLDAARARDWVRTRRGQQEVHLTPKGVSGFRVHLGVELRAPAG